MRKVIEKESPIDELNLCRNGYGSIRLKSTNANMLRQVFWLSADIWHRQQPELAAMPHPKFAFGLRQLLCGRRSLSLEQHLLIPTSVRFPKLLYHVSSLGGRSHLASASIWHLSSAIAEEFCSCADTELLADFAFARPVLRAILKTRPDITSLDARIVPTRTLRAIPIAVRQPVSRFPRESENLAPSSTSRTTKAFPPFQPKFTPQI